MRRGRLVAEEGRKWLSISQKMGRMPSNCRDRFREISVKHKNHGTFRGLVAGEGGGSAHQLTPYGRC